jgi:glutaredoxin-related protein
MDLAHEASPPDAAGRRYYRVFTGEAEMQEAAGIPGGRGGDHLEALKAEVASAPVVVFAARLTDVRPLVQCLDQVRLEHRVVTLSMADPSLRERFHVLEEWTGWGTLPQVFVDGRFIGGAQDLLAHPRLQGTVPASGFWIGWAGVLPFVVALFGYWFGPEVRRPDFAALFIAYGAVILTFVGAVHWGLVLGQAAGPEGQRRMIASGVPAVAACVALLLPVTAGAWLLFITFAAFRLWETHADVARPLPAWYRRLRTRLTLAVSTLLLIFALAAS